MLCLITDRFFALGLADMKQDDRDQHHRCMFDGKEPCIGIFHDCAHAHCLNEIIAVIPKIPKSKTNQEHQVGKYCQYGAGSCIGADERPVTGHETIENSYKK